MKWWKYLDWSAMKTTFRKLKPETRQKILGSGYWGKGRGHFYTKEEMKAGETDG